MNGLRARCSHRRPRRSEVQFAAMQKEVERMANCDLAHVSEEEGLVYANQNAATKVNWAACRDFPLVHFLMSRHCLVFFAFQVLCSLSRWETTRQVYLMSRVVCRARVWSGLEMAEHAEHLRDEHVSENVVVIFSTE